MSGDLLVRQVDSELQHFLPKLLHVIAGRALKMHVAARGASLLKQNTANATAFAYSLTAMILFLNRLSLEFIVLLLWQTCLDAHQCLWQSEP